MVEIQALSKRYAVDDGEIVALSSISVSVADSEFVCLLGPSGCGKSTLLKIVAGLIEPSGGSILINGREVTGPGPDRAVVFQDYALFPWMTVAENVEFGLAARSVEAARRRAVSAELLRAVDLSEFAGKYPHHLSGGMKQRVSIARALAVDPVLLLMDEPFGALDAQTRYVMQQELLRIWSAYRKTVLFVTHSIDEALYLGDRVLVMTARPGRIKEEIHVRQPRPRDIGDPEFSGLRKRALDLLAEETERSMAQESGAAL
ncbi:MAG: ABC transporter ATP-binding protein [Candidatus Rokuibacteriota bacterium]